MNKSREQEDEECAGMFSNPAFCLNCGKEFRFTGGNQICNKCKETMEYRDWPQRKDAESDYDFAYRVGFDDHILHWWQLQKTSPEFKKGYLDGKAEINKLVDIAAQSRCFG